jgi:GAF domain-containing protein
MSIAAFCFVAGIWGQIFLVWHSDKWEARLKGADDRTAQQALKTAEETSRADRQMKLHDEIRANRDFVLNVTESFLGVVGKKAEEVRKTVENGFSVSPKLSIIRESLNPDRQIVALLLGVFEIFRHPMNRMSSLRIACFQQVDGYMKPVYSWNGAVANCVQSPLTTHREKFAVAKGASESLVVWVVHNKAMEIIEDADAEDKKDGGRYHHHDNQQRKNIKSIVAIPLLRGDGLCSHVLTIDTDQPGFFSRTQAKELEFVARNLAQRLLFEQDMISLLKPLED